MRPVNLIPPEQRRGDAAPARAGAASYIVIAVLAAVLFAVTGVVLAGNSVNDKEAELASLEDQQAQVEARADALSSFASFKQMKDARVATVTALAQSRFDWERVMREVSLILPSSVWLTNLTGTVSPEVTVDKAAAVQLRSSVPGPALTMIGCARTQQAVAKLISAVGDIDGVTRVLAEKSEKPNSEVTSSSDGVNEDCRTRNFITKFGLVAAFDSVPVPSAAGTPAPTAPTPSPSAEATPAAADSGSTEGGQTAAPEETEQADNIGKGTDRARKAAGLLGAGD